MRLYSRPGNDLISSLLAAEIEGQKLSVAELLGFCSLLLVAGNETTTNLIGNAVLSFTEAPETIERLAANPSLLPQAIEEVLRYRSPVQSMYRVTATDTTLGGLPMLIYQGGLAFEIWTGVPAPIDVMFEAARRKLASNE